MYIVVALPAPKCVSAGGIHYVSKKISHLNPPFMQAIFTLKMRDQPSRNPFNLAYYQSKPKLAFVQKV